MRAEDAWNMAADAEVRKAKAAREVLFMEINNAANSGLYSIEIFSNISEELKKELISLGYNFREGQLETQYLDGGMGYARAMNSRGHVISWDK